MDSFQVIREIDLILNTLYSKLSTKLIIYDGF